MRNQAKSKQPQAVTLLELLVVVLIISLLATIATGVYTGEVQRARIAATKDLIHQLEIAITRYEIDLGQFPPSGSGDTLPPDPLTSNNAATRVNGSGFLRVALIHSMSGNANFPASPAWDGPYLNLQAEQVGVTTAGLGGAPGSYDILDAFDGPIVFIESKDYEFSGGGFSGGTRLFFGDRPDGSNPNLPAPNPFFFLMRRILLLSRIKPRTAASSGSPADQSIRSTSRGTDASFAI